MIEDATRYRSKEQVLCDLSKALTFSPDSLEANRKGTLSNDQSKKLSTRCLKPVVLTVVFTLAPFLFWAHSIASGDLISFAAGFPVLFHELANVNDLFELHGKMRGVIMLGSIVISLALAALFAWLIPGGLCLDLIAGRVIMQEGRVVAREEQINRPNGRDPIEKYFFSLRYLNMPVNLAAYRALEAGSIYLVYMLPRSETLVSIEPKIEAEVDPSASVKTSATMSAQGSAIRI